MMPTSRSLMNAAQIVRPRAGCLAAGVSAAAGGHQRFKLYARARGGDDEAIIDAELSAEELRHIGTLPRFFTHKRRCGST